MPCIRVLLKSICLQDDPKSLWPIWAVGTIEVEPDHRKRRGQRHDDQPDGVRQVQDSMVDVAEKGRKSDQNGSQW